MKYIKLFEYYTTEVDVEVDKVSKLLDAIYDMDGGVLLKKITTKLSEGDGFVDNFWYAKNHQGKWAQVVDYNDGELPLSNVLSKFSADILKDIYDQIVSSIDTLSAIKKINQ